MTILFIAPYSPVGSQVPALGASRKISLLVDALRRRGDKVIFLNTANNVDSGLGLRRERFYPPGVSVELALPGLAPRFLGRFLHVILLPFFCAIVASRYRPAAAWIYNLGAGELLGGYVASCGDVVSVVEVEDMPKARRRGLAELKPWLDGVVASFVPYAFERFMFVSPAVARQCSSYGGNSIVVQGLVGKVYIQAPVASFRVGYCGGLSAEKGADILFDLAREQGRKWPLSICGTGEWAERLARVMRPELGDCFILNASDEQVAFEISRCTLLLNPHVEISSLSEGVFPFKVVDYLNSSALLLSSDVGIPPKWTTELGISILPRSAFAFRSAIEFAAAGKVLLPTAALLARRRMAIRQFTADSALAQILPSGESGCLII